MDTCPILGRCELRTFPNPSDYPFCKKDDSTGVPPSVWPDFQSSRRVTKELQDVRDTCAKGHEASPGRPW